MLLFIYALRVHKLLTSLYLSLKEEKNKYRPLYPSDPETETKASRSNIGIWNFQAKRCNSRGKNSEGVYKQPGW
jgi:hypothetical protein